MAEQCRTSVHVIDDLSRDVDYTVVPMFMNAKNPDAFLKGYSLGYETQTRLPDASVVDVVETVSGQHHLGNWTIALRSHISGDPDILSGIRAGAWQAGADLTELEAQAEEGTE